jgi:S-adenosylmethionine:tRNA ribosyltransferase-isomerase
VKESGGKVEALVERVLDPAPCWPRCARRVAAARRRMRLADAFDVTVGERAGEFFTLHFDADVFELIERTAACRCRRTSSTMPTL